MPGAGYISKRNSGFIGERGLSMDHQRLINPWESGMPPTLKHQSFMGGYKTSPFNLDTLDRRFGKLQLDNRTSSTSLGTYGESSYNQRSYDGMKLYDRDDMMGYEDNQNGHSHLGSFNRDSYRPYLSRLSGYQRDQPQTFFNNREQQGIYDVIRKQNRFSAVDNSYIPRHVQIQHGRDNRFAPQNKFIKNERTTIPFGYLNQSRTPAVYPPRKFIKPSRPRMVASRYISNQPRRPIPKRVRPTKFNNKTTAKSKSSPSKLKKSTEDTEEDKIEDAKINGEATGDENEDDKEASRYPVQALYCHMCDIGDFGSKKKFSRHLKRDGHKRIAEIYHAKNAAKLEFLQQAAKLSALRQAEAITHKTGAKSPVLKKTVEQTLFNQFRKTPSCCGYQFQSLYESEEHKLTSRHLKEVYLKNEKHKPRTLPTSTIDDVAVTEEHVKGIIENAKKEAKVHPFNLNKPPPYDPNTLFGLEFFDTISRFRCEICGMNCTNNNLNLHCQSVQHYDNVIAHFKDKQEKKIVTAVKSESVPEKATEENGEEPTADDAVVSENSVPDESEDIPVEEVKENGVESPVDESPIIETLDEEPTKLLEGNEQVIDVEEVIDVEDKEGEPQEQ